MMHRHWLAALLLVSGQGMACAADNPSMGDARPSLVDAPSPSAAQGYPDEPPSAPAVAAYLADVLMPSQRARRTPTGYALLDKGSRVTHTTDVALTSHQCWKIKDGYQCRSTVRTTTTPANGRSRFNMLEVSNDYQWRGGRLFSARLESMRPQAGPAEPTVQITKADSPAP